MAKVYMHGTIGFAETVNLLSSKVPDCGLSCSLSDSADHRIGDVRVSVLVFEKYFMRSSNYASLTLVVSGRDGDVGVDIIGAGARQSLLSFTSWGTEESFVHAASDILSEHGFSFR